MVTLTHVTSSTFSSQPIRSVVFKRTVRIGHPQLHSVSRSLARIKARGELGVSYQLQQFIPAGKMDNLPTEILEEVFKNLSFQDLLSCMNVCRRWRTIIRSMRKRQGRARREWDLLVEGIVYLPLYDMEELKRRRLGLKVWAQKYGYLFPKGGGGGVL